jgi:hypothetical protein
MITAQDFASVSQYCGTRSHTPASVSKHSLTHSNDFASVSQYCGTRSHGPVAVSQYSLTRGHTPASGT